jgi:hypothetical protein
VWAQSHSRQAGCGHIVLHRHAGRDPYFTVGGGEATRPQAAGQRSGAADWRPGTPPYIHTPNGPGRLHCCISAPAEDQTFRPDFCPESLKTIWTDSAAPLPAGVIRVGWRAVIYTAPVPDPLVAGLRPASSPLLSRRPGHPAPHEASLAALLLSSPSFLRAAPHRPNRNISILSLYSHSTADAIGSAAPQHSRPPARASLSLFGMLGLVRGG